MLGQNIPNLLSVLEVWRWQNVPRWCRCLGTRDRLLATPLRRAQPSTIPHILLGVNHWLSETASLAWSSLGEVQHPQPTALGWALAAASVLQSTSSALVFRLFGLSFSTLHNSTGSCSEYFLTSGIWFWKRFFFVCLFTGFIWRHDIICQTTRWRQRVLNFHSGENQVQMLLLLWQILQEKKSK